MLRHLIKWSTKVKVISTDCPKLLENKTNQILDNFNGSEKYRLTSIAPIKNDKDYSVLITYMEGSL